MCSLVSSVEEGYCNSTATRADGLTLDVLCVPPCLLLFVVEFVFFQSFPFDEVARRKGEEQQVLQHGHEAAQGRPEGGHHGGRHQTAVRMMYTLLSVGHVKQYSVQSED